MKETLFLETLNVWTRRSLEKGTLCIRWMDDVLHVAVRSMGRAAKAALKRMQRKKFYGEGLDLLEEEGETRAFGFEWEANGSVLVCRGVNQSEAEENSGAAMKGVSVVQGTQHFCDVRRRGGAALGRLLRVLDTTNAPEEDVKRQAGRVICELRSVGYTEQELTRIIRKAQKEAWFSMADMYALAKAPKAAARAAARIDDVLRRCERQVPKIVREAAEPARLAARR